MKCLLLFLLVFTLTCAMLAQTSSSTETTTSSQTQTVQTPAAGSPPAAPAAPEPRLFFAKGWYWGWAEFDIDPPHNEADPNLCASNAGQFGGVNSKCNAFARYMLSSEVEIRPIGRTIARRLMFFFDPNFLFGKNVPQTLYTWSWDPIGMEYKWGVGIDLPKRFEVRFTQHPQIQRFGARDQFLGPAYLGPNGPWGQYNGFGVRKYFGSRRQEE